MAKYYQIETIYQQEAISDITKTKILFITANENEYKAVISFLKPRESKTKLLKYRHECTFGFLKRTAEYTFGRFSDYGAAVHLMVKQGPAAAQSAIITAATCFKENLQAIFAVGVACGVDKDKIKMLDVIVAETVTFYTNARISSFEDGNYNIESRSPAYLDTSLQFRGYFKGLPEWPGEQSSIIKRLRNRPQRRFGNVLSGNYLIDNKKIKNFLIEKFSRNAIGIEMESAGLFYENDSHHVQLMLVKAVCDFGDGSKDKKYQPTAALLAAECVHHYLSKGKI